MRPFVCNWRVIGNAFRSVRHTFPCGHDTDDVFCLNTIKLYMYVDDWRRNLIDFRVTRTKFKVDFGQRREGIFHSEELLFGRLHRYIEHVKYFQAKSYLHWYVQLMYTTKIKLPQNCCQCSTERMWHQQKQNLAYGQTDGHGRTNRRRTTWSLCGAMLLVSQIVLSKDFR